MWMKPILWAVLAAVVLALIVVFTRAPRHDRVWKDDVSRLAGAVRDGDAFRIEDYRNWVFNTGGPTRKTWRPSGAFKISDVERVWFVVEPHPGVPGMAHTMVVFEFADQQLLGLSVEARKEAEEPYSIVRGALNGFELTYVWASPQDMFTRRVLTQDHEIYMYELNLTPAEEQAFLGALLNKTIAIQERPRFYNTFLSNCTNELAKTASLPWRPAFIFTGTSGKALHKMDRIRGEGAFEDVKAKARVDETVREIAALDEQGFNAALLKALKP
jgi:hypothetical protein